MNRLKEWAEKMGKWVEGRLEITYTRKIKPQLEAQTEAKLGKKPEVVGVFGRPGWDPVDLWGKGNKERAGGLPIKFALALTDDALHAFRYWEWSPSFKITVGRELARWNRSELTAEFGPDSLHGRRCYIFTVWTTGGSELARWSGSRLGRERFVTALQTRSGRHEKLETETKEGATR